MSAVHLYLDVNAASGLQWEDVRSVRGLVHLLPETTPLQGASDQPATRECTRCCMWYITQGSYRTPETSESST